jgi:membrane protease YdiL (CAAX protease family)
VTWGPQLAIGGLLIALGIGVLLSVPVAIVESPAEGEDLSTTASVLVQLATALGFLLVPVAIASQWGKISIGEALRRLGVRGFGGEAIGWMVVTTIAYLIFAAAYAGIFGVPEQEDIAEGFGTLPVQILLIVIAAPISEELLFRGLIFAGIRKHMPSIAAALVAGLIFGALHALTGLSAVPPLIFFGFILCLLYERTGSIVPGIILHMLNNSVALIGQ